MGVARARLDAVASEAVGREVSVLFEEHGRMVLGLCRLLLRDAMEAEDAAQQTFLSAHRSLLNGTRPRKPDAWLAAIARNECQARAARRHARPALIPLDGCPEPEATKADPAILVSEHEHVDELRDAIAKLPGRQRHALLLRHFYGLSYTEVAAALGVGVPAVEQLLLRARRRVRDLAGDLPQRVAAPLTVPASLRDELAGTIPGFEPAASAAGAGLGGVVLAKLASTPTAAKVAASVTAIAIGTGAGVTQVVQPKARETPRAPSTAAAVHERTSAVAVPRPAKRVVAASAARASAGPERRREAVERAALRPARGRDGDEEPVLAALDSDSEAGSNDSGSPGSSGSGSSGSGSPGTSESDSSGSRGSGSAGSGSDSGSSGSGSGSFGSGSSGSGSGSSDSGLSGSGSSGSGSSSGSSGGSSNSGPGSSGSDWSSSASSDPDSSGSVDRASDDSNAESASDD